MPQVVDFLRPSSMAAIEACPARPSFECGAVEMLPALAGYSSPIARQGTMAHDVAAHVLALIYHGPVHKSPAEAMQAISSALSGLEPWAADACRRCVAYVVGLVDSMKESGLRAVVEVEMHLPGRGFHIPRGGTADVVLLGYSGNVLKKVIVEDHKTGFLDQGHAADHLQLHIYAGMAWDKYAKDGPVDMEVHLAQGRRRDYSAARFTADDIERIRSRSVRAVEHAQAPDPAVVPGIEQCRYCKALTFCRAARSVITSACDEVDTFGVLDAESLDEQVAMARRLSDAAQEVAQMWQSVPPEEPITDGKALYGHGNEDRALLAETAGRARRLVRAVADHRKQITTQGSPS